MSFWPCWLLAQQKEQSWALPCMVGMAVAPGMAVSTTLFTWHPPAGTPGGSEPLNSPCLAQCSHFKFSPVAWLWGACPKTHLHSHGGQCSPWWELSQGWLCCAARLWLGRVSPAHHISHIPHKRKLCLCLTQAQDHLDFFSSSNNSVLFSSLDEESQGVEGRNMPLWLELSLKILCEQVKMPHQEMHVACFCRQFKNYNF